MYVQDSIAAEVVDGFGSDFSGGHNWAEDNWSRFWAFLHCPWRKQFWTPVYADTV